MKRYLFEYVIKSENKTSEFSIVKETEKEARIALKERVADLEFVDEEDVEVGKLIKTQDATKHFYECEGCT